jgi:hypothetical protein
MKIHHRRARRYGSNEFPLFDWLAEQDLKISDPAARLIARRFGLTIHHANVIARIAGLGGQSR